MEFGNPFKTYIVLECRELGFICQYDATPYQANARDSGMRL